MKKYFIEIFMPLESFHYLFCVRYSFPHFVYKGTLLLPLGVFEVSEDLDKVLNDE